MASALQPTGVGDAARWLVAIAPPARPRPIVPELQRRFGLAPAEACKAICETDLVQARVS